MFTSHFPCIQAASGAPTAGPPELLCLPGPRTPPPPQVPTTGWVFFPVSCPSSDPGRCLKVLLGQGTLALRYFRGGEVGRGEAS